MKSTITTVLCSVSVTLFLGVAIIAATSPLEFEGVKLVRNARQAVAPISGITTGKENLTGLNMAEEFSDDYPVVFNILLWFGIAMFITLLAVSVFIASMDPGRDSLIYRVTSAQRFKKDN